MPPVGTRTHNLSTRAAADLRLRSRGHWDWLNYVYIYQISNKVQFGSPDVLTVTHVLVSGNVTIRLQSVQELVRVAVVR